LGKVRESRFSFTPGVTVDDEGFMRSRLRIFALLASLMISTESARAGDSFPVAAGPDRTYPVPLPALATLGASENDTELPRTNEGVRDPEPASLAKRFGTPGTSHWLAVMMPCYAPAADEVVYAFDLERNYYFLQNTSINAHIQGFYFDQLGPNAWAFGPALTIRHSFFVRERSRFFVMGGVGVMYSDNPIPEIIGSRFNLTPRASLGYVYSLNELTSIVTGLRVSHIDSLIEPGYSRTVLQYFVGLSIVLL